MTMIMQFFLVLMSALIQGISGFHLKLPAHIPIERFPTLRTAASGGKLQSTENTVATLQSQLSSVLERLDNMEKEVDNRRRNAASRISSLEEEQKELKAKLDVATAKSSTEADAMKSDFHSLQSDLRTVKLEVQSVNSSLQEGLESKSEKAEEHMRQLTDRLSRAEAKASMGSPCNDNTDCLVERSLCIHDVCVCDPGLAYHPEKNKCVDNCTTYGQHYTTLRGYYIGDHNVENLHGVSETQCKDACTAATSFVCRSADLLTRNGLCSLTFDSLKTVPKSSYRVENDISIITHFSRNCLN